MASPANLTLYRRAFVDVCRGYSIGHTKAGEAVYVRHLSHFEHQEYDALQARFEQEAAAQGAQSEAQRLDELYAKGQWTLAREAEIPAKRDFISRLEEGRKTIAVPIVLKSHEDSIAREKKALQDVLIERARLVGVTTETYAARRLEDYYLVHNLFKDRELTTLFYEPGVFDGLDDDAVDAIHEVYREAVEPCTDVNLRKLAAQDLFVSYFSLAADDARAFFGRPVCELTYYQVRLLNSGRYVKALLDNTDMSKVPLDQRNDPEALERFHSTQKATSAILAKGEVPVGLSPAEAKAAGVPLHQPPPPGLSGVELVAWMRKQQVLAPR